MGDMQTNETFIYILSGEPTYSRKLSHYRAQEKPIFYRQSFERNIDFCVRIHLARVRSAMQNDCLYVVLSVLCKATFLLS